MNGKTARRLRRIAASLELPKETAYAPGGELRRKPSYRDEEGILQPGPPIPRPIVLRECARRAYREAKKIFKGRPISICVPETKDETSFQVRVVDSMKKYANTDHT
jgi:hypothetical protein